MRSGVMLFIRCRLYVGVAYLSTFVHAAHRQGHPGRRTRKCDAQPCKVGDAWLENSCLEQTLWGHGAIATATTMCMIFGARTHVWTCTDVRMHPRLHDANMDATAGDGQKARSPDTGASLTNHMYGTCDVALGPSRCCFATTWPRPSPRPRWYSRFGSRACENCVRCLPSAQRIPPSCTTCWYRSCSHDVGSMHYVRMQSPC